MQVISASIQTLGTVAHLGERDVGNVEVVGSFPISSTKTGVIVQREDATFAS